MHLNGGKLLKCYLNMLKGKTCKELANGQTIAYFEMSPGLHLPLYFGYMP